MNADDILGHPTLSERLFFPRPDAPPDVFPVRSCGETLACWHHRPFPEARTVVFYHGNGETVADYVPFWGKIFEERGLNVFLAEYRGYGASTGSPGLAGILDDVEPVFRALDLPADRLIPFGRSLGSICAVELAARHPDVAGLILESAIAEPVERILIRVTPEEIGVPEDRILAAAKERLDHRSKLAAYRGPLLVMHARRDSLLPVSNGARLHEFAGGEEKELLVFPDGDHNDVMAVNWDAYWAAVDRFLDRLG